MRALSIARYGRNVPLELTEREAPAAGPGEVLVEVHAASVNPVDLKTRNGDLREMLKYRFPLVLGMDLSGLVRTVGPGVTGWQPGDEVFVRLDKLRIGAFAELAAVRADLLAPKPRRLSHVEAASIPLAGLTAYQALVELGQLRAGQTVLIQAGAGGVGTLAIQLAKHLGAKVLTTASARNHALVRSLGADVAIDYATQRFEDVAKDVDLVFDSLGGADLLRAFACVKRGGAVISISGIPDAVTAREYKLNAVLRLALAVLNRKLVAAARRAGARYRFLFMRPDGAQLAELGRLCEEGRLRPVIEKTYSFEQGAQALAHVEGGRVRGKVVIAIR